MKLKSNEIRERDAAEGDACLPGPRRLHIEFFGARWSCLFGHSFHFVIVAVLHSESEGELPSLGQQRFGGVWPAQATAVADMHLV